jgi:hypothetical protein
MKRFISSVLAAALATGVSLAQNPAQPVGDTASQNTVVRFAPGTILRVELAKSVDAKKAKVGDEVIGKTMDDFLGDKNDMLAPKGSRVLAHVAEVSPRQGESASTLGIAFDKMVLKNGADVPFKAAIQAIGGPDLSAAPANQPMPQSGGGAPTMNPAHDPESYGGSMGRGDVPANSGATGPLPPNARGVVGISGVSLSAGSAEDSLISSQKHNVKLDSGTQMILRVMQ